MDIAERTSDSRAGRQGTIGRTDRVDGTWLSLLRGALVAATACLALAVGASAARAQSFSGSNQRGTSVLSNPHAGVQLLRSFSVQFTNSDHHLRTIGFLPGAPTGQQLQLSFADSNSDDPYSYYLQFYDAPAAPLYSSGASGSCRGVCTVYPPRPAGDYVFVIRGFVFSFPGDSDNHLRRIKIGELNGAVTVAFHDADSSGNTDVFTYNVWYSYVPRSLFSNVGGVSGRAAGSQSTTIPGGSAVIRGFDLRYVDSDHHVDQLGIYQSGGGQLNVYLNDGNNDDLFDWNVDFGIVR